MDPDPFHFGQPDPGSKKSEKIMENFHENQPKSLEYHKKSKTKLIFLIRFGAGSGSGSVISRNGPATLLFG